MTFFNRFDLRPNERDSLHLNLQAAKSGFDVPNTYDQNDLGQTQHQDITTFNVAPGYSRVLRVDARCSRRTASFGATT